MAKNKDEQQEVEETVETAEENVQPEAENAAPKEPSEMEQLTAKLNEALVLADDFKRKWYAVTAEYDNYRKRTQATASQKYAEGRSDIILKILPIGDNIDRALAVCNDEKMKQGLEMVKANFEKTLEDEGVTSFDPTGEEFDSMTSTAIAAFPHEEGEAEGIVRQTFLKGYKKGDKILRFAQVVVT
ncbi:MAG: nucleotide exchange factor GrpE, partial [Clostridia bacterium]|nr:nucleotide exchange factor GrpE [Clostridia bacterium]